MITYLLEPRAQTNKELPKVMQLQSLVRSELKTHRSQSTAMMREMSLVGSPTAVSTSSMVTRPALGTDAAPILASVAVKLPTIDAVVNNSQRINHVRGTDCGFQG